MRARGSTSRPEEGVRAAAFRGTGVREAGGVRLAAGKRRRLRHPRAKAVAPVAMNPRAAASRARDLAGGNGASYNHALRAPGAGHRRCTLAQSDQQ